MNFSTRHQQVQVQVQVIHSCHLTVMVYCDSSGYSHVLCR